MYSGEKLGEAIRVAIRMKGVTQKEVADFFNIKQQSISAWLKNGRVGKEHLEKMIEYFSDVVPPSHFGIDSLVLNQNINANHNSGLNQSNTINNFLPSETHSGSLKIVCDNPEFESVVVENDDVQIIGRVVRWVVDDN